MTKCWALGPLIILLVLIVIFTLAAPVAMAQCYFLPPAQSASAAAKPAAGLSSLPLDAQGPISAALGKGVSSYWIHSSAAVLRGENPRQALTADFTKRGAEILSHGLQWGLGTRAYGYGDALRPVKAVTPKADRNRVEYRRGGVTEWYENGPLGLEQGFTLAHRPGKANGQPLTLQLSLRGDLVAALEPGPLNKKSRAVELRSRDGKAALRYAGLEARDATGRELPSWLEVRKQDLLVRVEDSGAHYPVVVDPWIQQQEMTASDGAEWYMFGYSVAISSSMILVGAPNENYGTAYVFVQNDDKTWVQQGELIPSDGAQGDFFGQSVGISGGAAVVGAPNHMVGANTSQGAAYVFTQSDGTWSQQAELTASDGAAYDHFGYSVGANGGTIVVGAPYHTVGSIPFQYQGAAYVFVGNSGTWSQQAELTASDGEAWDVLGLAVAVSGSTALAGAPGRAIGANSEQGAAYVFSRSGEAWGQQAELIASDGAENDCFGFSVGVGSGTTVVGAFNHAVGQGAVYVFMQNGATWSQQAELTASDGAAWDFFGASVAVVGGRVVAAGAPLHNVGSNAEQGAAYVFVRSGSAWPQRAELIASDGAADDLFGSSVAADSSTVAVGAPFRSVGSNLEQGAAYSFGVPPVKLSPPEYAFYRTKVGNTSIAHTFTLKNNLPITLTGISYSTAAPFAVSSSTCGTTLNSRESCTISVTFSPTQDGPASGTLTVNDSASNSPQTVSLSGTGVD